MREDLERELAALHPSCFGWALACCGRDASEASDVLQDVYFKVLSGRATWDGRAALKTWLFGVIRLTAHEQRRFRWVRGREVPTRPEDTADVPASSGPRVDKQTAAAVARAMLHLSERQREVLHLVFYEELSIAEASQVMKVSLGTARLHYERGKASMLALLTKEGVTL